MIGNPQHRRNGDMIASRESAKLKGYVGKVRSMSNDHTATARLPKPPSPAEPQAPVKFDDWAAI
jgi:hypothetical protein